ncbi:hypothetical protein [Psychroflexus lacisalsi]|jgi:hypothetical protein|uniref:Uncharacterized protein n=1 Tax=Psychroflexus lacisalsi TaxID=503928 RepID=A0ABN1K0C9_9FLAO|nr:hypothetical protein [Psychroflexus lacisalsi]MBZ9620967.1 hypothetical protein [Psychroflexus lacisalsi]
MTLKQAKEADQVLFFLINNIEGKVDFKKIHNKISDFLIENKSLTVPWNLIDLFIVDEFISKTYYERPQISGKVFQYHITEKANTFLSFDGGYFKLIKGKIENERRKRNKYRFDIAKDIVLISLAIGTLIISYMTS